MELGDEITQLNKEINEIQQDNSNYNILEKRYDSLVKTVRALEGDLADHNLATDKQRTDTRPEEVHHMYTLMKSQNDQQRNDVDQIFLEKRSHEDEINRMDSEIDKIARAAEEKLSELHPDQRREYEMLKEENGRLSQEVTESREEWDQVNGRLNVLEGRLHVDVLRTQYVQLSSVRKEMAERLDTLEIEVQQCSMSVPEQREHLLTKVKSDNGEIVAVEKRNSELKLDNERLRAQIREVTADAQEKKEEGGNDQQKYEILFSKDQEMTQFIDGFDASKAEEEKKLKEKQESIKALLENISKACVLPSDVTPESHFTDMQEELDFKNRQLQNSESTQNRLEAELTKREGELEKIESLDVKISLELQQVEAKMKQYEYDIEKKYDLVGELKDRGEDTLRKLEVQKQSLQSRQTALKRQVTQLRIGVDGKKRQLLDDETGANLEAQEKKISLYGQNLHSLRSYIDQKVSETDCRFEMATCLETCTLINKMLQDQMQRPAPCA
jgi:intraflagellar transport protein 74